MTFPTMPTRFDIRRCVRLAPETGVGAPVPPVPPRPSDGPAPMKADRATGGGFSALRVSLMPADESAGRPDLRKRLLVLAITLAIETLVIGGTYVLLESRTRSQQAELEDLRKQEQALSGGIKKQEAEADELAAFAMQVGAIVQRLDEHVHWTNVFTLLEQYTKPDVRFENFAGGLSGRVVTLSAVAPTYRAMAEQILAFRAAPMVRGVRADAGISELDELGQLSGVKWNMVLDLDPAIWQLTAKDAVKNPAASTPVVVPAAAP